jgi:hypothetical protein
MINTLKKQISECEKEIKKHYDKYGCDDNCDAVSLCLLKSKLSTLQSCLKLAEETKEKLKEKLTSPCHLHCETLGVIEKTFGETK